MSMKEPAVKVPNMAFMALKAGAALLFLIFLIYMLAFTITSFAEGDGVSEADLIGWCEDDYYARDYAGLYDTLTLFDLYGERFAKYWDAVNEYNEGILKEQAERGFSIDNLQLTIDN